MDPLLLICLLPLLVAYLVAAAITHFELLALKQKVTAALADARSSIQMEAATLRDLEKAARNAGNHEKHVHIRTNDRWSRSAGQRGRGGAGIHFSHQQNNFAQLHAPMVHGDIGRLIGPQREHVDRSIEKANETIREYETLRLSFWYLPFREFMKPMVNVTPKQLAGGMRHGGHGKKKKPLFRRQKGKVEAANHPRSKRRRK